MVEIIVGFLYFSSNIIILADNLDGGIKNGLHVIIEIYGKRSGKV